MRTPASILATPEARKLGYVERWSAPRRTKEEVLREDYELRRSEETHASVSRWEQRSVTADPWLAICPVCDDEGTVTVEAHRSGREVEQESRPCSAPGCLAGRVTRVYRQMEKS